LLCGKLLEHQNLLKNAGLAASHHFQEIAEADSTLSSAVNFSNHFLELQVSFSLTKLLPEFMNERQIKPQYSTGENEN